MERLQRWAKGLQLVSEPIMWLACYICMLAYRSLLISLCEIHGIIGIGYCEWSDYVLLVNSYLIRTEILMVICWTQYMSYWKWYIEYMFCIWFHMDWKEWYGQCVQVCAIPLKVLIIRESRWNKCYTQLKLVWAISSPFYYIGYMRK